MIGNYHLDSSVLEFQVIKLGLFFNILSLIIFFFLGCPAIVVGISAGLASEGYGNKRL